MTDRGQFADPEKKSLLSAASKVQHLTPAIGTELSGIDLRQLTDQQKDELCVSVPFFFFAFQSALTIIPLLLD